LPVDRRFFAELSTADDRSGIVFDDPVSSLDYRWRESVARRLVQEARSRQVIVFTHDVVFLLLLKQFAEEFQIPQLDQHVRHLSKGAGVCANELPWVALPVRKKIGYLNKEWQTVDKLFRDGHHAAFSSAHSIFEHLRGGLKRRMRIHKIRQISPVKIHCLKLNYSGQRGRPEFSRP